MASETPPELIEEARSLIHRLLDDDLTQDQVAPLSELICGHREIARLYLRYMHLHRLLPRYVAAQDLILSDGDLSATMILPALVEDDSSPFPDGLLSDDGMEIQPAAATQPETPGRWKQWRWAAAILLPLVAVLVAYLSIRGSAPPTPTVARNTTTSQTHNSEMVIADRPSVKPTPAPIVLSKATLTGTIAAHWTGTQHLAVGSHLPLGMLHLQSGLARLRFENNVIAIVKAPASFEISSAMQLGLSSGSISVDVPVNAHHFAVQTPSAKVVDLGTEFGVATAAESGTHVEVFKGKVLASALAAPPGTAPRLLTKDQAAEVPVGASVVHSAALKREEFVRSKEFTIVQQKNESAFHRWLAYSYQLRHDPTLALYYPFETPSSAGRIPNGALTSFQQFGLTLSSQTPPIPRIGTGRWPEKSAVIFDSTKHERLQLPDCPLSKTGKLTVAAWVNASSRPRWATIAKSRGDSVTGQFSLALFSIDGDLVGRACQADGTDVEIRQGKQFPFPTDQWVFVALVADGQQLRIYRDAVEVASAPCTAVIANPQIHSLSIGFQPANDGISTRRQSEGYWNGAIDELAFFHRPLSALQIKQMYEAGKPN